MDQGREDTCVRQRERKKRSTGDLTQDLFAYEVFGLCASSGALSVWLTFLSLVSVAVHPWQCTWRPFHSFPTQTHLALVPVKWILCHPPQCSIWARMNCATKMDGSFLIPGPAARGGPTQGFSLEGVPQAASTLSPTKWIRSKASFSLSGTIWNTVSPFQKLEELQRWFKSLSRLFKCQFRLFCGLERVWVCIF